MFRDESVITARRVNRHKHKKQCRRRVVISRKVELKQPKQLSPQVQQTAIERFFYDFVVSNDTDLHESMRYGGYLSLIPDMYRRCEPHSAFQLALSAAANANFWKRHKSTQGRHNSVKYYHEALEQLQDDLQFRSRLQLTPDLMTTSSLLAMYELIVSEDISQRINRTAHVNGAVAFLDSEFQNNQVTRRSAGVFRESIIQMLIDCMVAGAHPRLSRERCVSVMKRKPPSTALVGFMHTTARLCAIWKDYQSAQDGAGVARKVGDIADFLEKCQILDGEAETWMLGLPHNVAVRNLPNVESNIPAPLWDLFAMPGAPETLRLCADIGQTHGRHLSRACRLTLLHLMLAAVDAALDLTTTTDIDLAGYKARLVSRTSELVNDLLSTVFSTLTVKISSKTALTSMVDLQGLRGLELLWPLHTAGICLMRMGQHCPDGSAKLDWVRALFRCIKDDIGIQTADNFLRVSDKLLQHRKFLPSNSFL